MSDPDKTPPAPTEQPDLTAIRRTLGLILLVVVLVLPDGLAGLAKRIGGKTARAKVSGAKVSRA